MRGILVDETGELRIKPVKNEKGEIISGLVLGDLTLQNQQAIIVSEKGEIREMPMLGVGIASYIGETDPTVLLRKIRKNLHLDGQKVSKCGLDKNGILNIEGGYEND